MSDPAFNERDVTEGISAKDHCEIMLEIEKVAGDNRIVVTDDLFSFTARKNGTISPLLSRIAPWCSYPVLYVDHAVRVNAHTEWSISLDRYSRQDYLNWPGDEGFVLVAGIACGHVSGVASSPPENKR